MPKGVYERNPNGYGRKIGWKLSEETKRKMSQRMMGNSITKNIFSNENNPSWKGDNAGYRAIHIWINLHKIKPNRCSMCGKDKKLDWANIDHKYRRDINDYLALCRKCHGEYDKKLGLRKHKKKETKCVHQS